MSERANIALVSVGADLDVTTVPVVRRRMDRLVAQGCRRVFMNMAGVEHVDSAGMGLILTELRCRYVVVGNVALDVLADKCAHVIRCGELLAYGTYLLLDSKHVIIRGVNLEYDIRYRAVGLLRI